MEFTTTRGGYRYSTSVGGPTTGRGGNMFILDDMLKAEDALSDSRRSAPNDWFDGTLYSRLDDKRNDVIILTMQRLHLDDLAGHVLRKEPWVHLNLPAIAEEEHRVQVGPDEFYVRQVGDLLDATREPLDVLERLKAGMTSFQFSAQYQQCPIPLEGEIIKWEWFPRYDETPRREAGDQVVQSWDTASKADEINDYSVCTTFLIKGDQFFVLDVLRERLNFPDLKRRVTEQALRFGADAILIEDKGSGTSLIQELSRERPPGVMKPIAIMPEGDKVTRMGAASFRIESKQVYLPRRADWLEELRNELLQFPFGSYDDQVDSLSQCLNWFNQRRRGTLRQIQL